MTYCSHFDDVEDLAIGTLPLARRSMVEAHVERCETCCAELAMVRAERELFARRASVGGSTPSWLASTIRTRAVAVKKEPLLSRIARTPSSHAYATAMAAVVVLASISRLGGTPSAVSKIEMAHDADSSTTGVLASFRTKVDEPLACFVGASSAGTPDECMTTPYSTAPSIETTAEVLACGGASEAAAMCELDVTSAMSRQ